MASHKVDKLTPGIQKQCHNTTMPYSNQFTCDVYTQYIVQLNHSWAWYQKGETNLDFTEARDSEWRWHQLGYMQVCNLLQTDNHASTPPLSFLQAGCPSCRPTNSVKALKA